MDNFPIFFIRKPFNFDNDVLSDFFAGIIKFFMSNPINYPTPLTSLATRGMRAPTNQLLDDFCDLIASATLQSFKDGVDGMDDYKIAVLCGF